MCFTVLGAVAELERSLIVEPRKLGFFNARQRLTCPIQPRLLLSTQSFTRDCLQF